MNPRLFSALRLVLVLALPPAFTACSSLYYGTMEKIGIAKRDILVDRVEEAREAQTAAKEQFSSALEQFLAVTRVEGGELQQRYDQLNREFTRSEQRAARVRERIAAVEDVSGALFREWEEELDDYQNDAFRRQSERQLATTRQRYEEMMRLMHRAADRMEPVLSTFRDQTLFLKHNLNARAIASLDSTAAELETEIAQLVRDMEESIREADAFINSIQGEES